MGVTNSGLGSPDEIQPGHDGWVVGDEAVMSVEFSGEERSVTKG